MVIFFPVCLPVLKGFCNVSVYFDTLPCSSDLRKNVENLEKNSVTSLRTMVNLGSEVYMQAEV